MEKISWKRLSMAALLLTGVLFLTAGCDYLKATFNRKGYLEEQARPLVTKLLRDEDYNNVECIKVKITENIDSKNYKAKATLDNGEELDIKVEDRGESFWVKVDNTSHNTLKFYARELVTQILQRQLGENEAAKCTGVEITDQIDDKTYRGRAHLDNGNSCDISIENRGDQIYVQLLIF